MPCGDERLDVGLDRSPTRDAVHVAARVGDGDEVDTRQAAQDAGVVAAHHPEPEQARTQVGHQAPAPARALTAATIRSRSSWLSEGCTGSDRHSRGGPLGLGQVDVDLERQQAVVRDRVEHARADVVLLAQRRGEPVAVVGHAHRVLVVDVHRTVGDRRAS